MLEKSWEVSFQQFRCDHRYHPVPVLVTEEYQEIGSTQKKKAKFHQCEHCEDVLIVK